MISCFVSAISIGYLVSGGIPAFVPPADSILLMSSSVLPAGVLPAGVLPPSPPEALPSLSIIALFPSPLTSLIACLSSAVRLSNFFDASSI